VILKVMASCENKVDHEETLNIPWKKEESFSFKLKSNDTPGIVVSQGSSKEFLNEKAQTIERKRESINLLIVLF
jgi:hypothetical protein